MVDDRSRFALSDADNERIFRERIVPKLFADIEGRAENPTVVFLGGQPGAGKSSSLKQAEHELLQQGPTIVIEGDSYRPYHPQYAMLQVTEPLASAFYTGDDAGKWTSKAIAEAKERGLSVVLETTFRQPEVVAKTMAEFRDAGYEVDARALAVSERQSWQNVHTRFENMIAAGQQARFTLREAHDAAATGMVVTLGEIERQNLADRVSIYKFGGDKIYENKLVNGAWERAPEAANVVVQERQRPLTVEESARFHQGWQEVIEAMEHRRARPAELEKVKMQAVADQQWTATIAEGVGSDRRAIFDKKPDELKLFTELYEGTLRDQRSNLGLGNVAAHAEGRLLQTYGTLKLVEGARELGLVPEGTVFVGTRAQVQDKQTSQEYPAAHRLPCDLAVQQSDGSHQRLTDHLQQGLSKAWVDRNLIAPTDRVQRLVNVVDSQVEAAGMKTAFVTAANAVASGQLSAERAMSEIVKPGYARAVATVADRIQSGWSAIERDSQAVARLLDQHGQPFKAVNGLALTSKDVEVRAAAKSIMEQTLEVYARHSALSEENRRDMAQKIGAIVINERQEQQTRNYLVAPQKIPDLTEAEITARVAGSSQVEKARSQVEVKARLVYGDLNAGERLVQGVNRNPASAEAVGTRLRTDASQFGDLAGRAGGMLRSASPDRITAEAETLPLARAVEDYGRALQNERQKILDVHKQEQQRVARGIEEPSPQLRQALGAPEQERQQRLTSPGLADELRRFNQQMDARLSQADRAAIHQGNHAQLGKSLGVSQNRAHQLGQLHQQSTTAARTQQQAKQIVQAKGPVIQR